MMAGKAVTAGLVTETVMLVVMKADMATTVATEKMAVVAVKAVTAVRKVVLCMEFLSRPDGRCNHTLCSHMISCITSAPLSRTVQRSRQR